MSAETIAKTKSNTSPSSNINYNWLALISFICACIGVTVPVLQDLTVLPADNPGSFSYGLFFGVLAIALGHVAHHRGKVKRQRGTAWSTAALCIIYAALALTIVIVLVGAVYLVLQFGQFLFSNID